jgi:hypothetical protein
VFLSSPLASEPEWVRTKGRFWGIHFVLERESVGVFIPSMKKLRNLGNQIYKTPFMCVIFKRTNIKKKEKHFALKEEEEWCDG